MTGEARKRALQGSGHFLLLVAVLGVFLGSEAGVGQEEEVGGLGDPSRITIRGSTTFDEDDVRRELCSGPDYVLSSHPCAPLAGYLRFVEDRLRRGFLRAGFPEVQVDVRLDRAVSRIEVRLQEGARWTAGEVVVEGNETLDAETIARALAAAEPNVPEAIQALVDQFGWDSTGLSPDLFDDGDDVLWKPGEPARLDSLILSKVDSKVLDLYRSQGWAATEVASSVRPPQGDAVPLLVKVLDEGRRWRLGNVRVEGCDDSPGQLRELLGLRPGLELSADVLNGIRRDLASLGRYSKAEVKTFPRSGGDSMDLTLRLFVASYGRALGAAASVEAQVLAKAIAWIRDVRNWQGPLTLRLESSASEEAGRFRVLELAISKDGFVAYVEGLQVPQSGPWTVGIALLNEELVLISDRLGGVVRVGFEKGPKVFGIVNLYPADPEEKGTGGSEDGARMFLGGTVGTDLGPEFPFLFFHVHCPEVLFSYVLGMANLETRWEESRLVVSWKRDDAEPLDLVQIDRETGQVHGAFRLRREGGVVFVGFDDETLARKRDRLVSRISGTGVQEVPASRFVLAGARALFRAHMAAESERRPRGVVGRYLLAVVERALQPGGPVESQLSALFSRWREPKPRKPARLRFKIPRSIEDYGLQTASPTAMLGMVATAAVPHLPAGSWMQSLVRETGLLLFGETRMTSLELRRLQNSTTVGPVGYWAFSEALRFAGFEPLSRRFAATALVESRLSGLRKEGELLREWGPLGPKLLEELGRAAWTVDLSTLGAREDLPPEEAEALERLRGVGDIEDPVEAGIEVLQILWEVDLADLLRSRLERLRAGIPRTQET